MRERASRSGLSCVYLERFRVTLPVAPHQARPASGTSEPSVLLTIVIPAFNEGRNLPLLADRLTPVLEAIDPAFEVLVIDDGSRDDTALQIALLHEADPRYRGLSFSRNFGKEIAIAAGLDHARGKATVNNDAD